MKEKQESLLPAPADFNKLTALQWARPRLPDLIPTFVDPSAVTADALRQSIVRRTYLSWLAPQANALGPDEVMIDCTGDPLEPAKIEAKLNSFQAEYARETGFNPDDVITGCFYQQYYRPDIHVLVLGLDNKRIFIQASSAQTSVLSTGNIKRGLYLEKVEDLHWQDWNFTDVWLYKDVVFRRAYERYLRIRQALPELAGWGLHLEMVLSGLKNSEEEDNIND